MYIQYIHNTMLACLHGEISGRGVLTKIIPCIEDYNNIEYNKGIHLLCAIRANNANDHLHVDGGGV